MLRPLLCTLALVFAVAGGSCTYLPQRAGAVTVVQNPIFVPAANPDVLWERTADVLHYYPFYIVREDKLDGVIETDYKVGSSLLEPWHKETIGLEERTESSLQSIRRKVLVTIRPVDGGHLVVVEAVKELEDAAGVAAGAPIGNAFSENRPLQRDQNVVAPELSPPGWIPVGRDFLLEQDLLQRLQAAYCR